MAVKKTRQGAASYYMVIVCALLFGVITAGFITLMLSEVKKSGENNLSQSAYDSAIVGVEDAKILLVKYGQVQAGLIEDPNNEITKAVDNSDGNECNSIGTALGRSMNGDSVLIQEVGTDSSTTVQEYTCVHLDFTPPDYLATLNGSSPIRLIPLNSVDGNSAIKSVRISWYSSDNLGSQTTSFSNNVSGNKVNFSDSISNPPVLVASIYQTGENFELEDFSDTSNDKTQTNRGTLWLTPTDGATYESTAKTIYGDMGTAISGAYYNSWASSFTGTTKQRTNILTEKALLDSNDHSTSNNAFPVRCATNSEASGLDYLCSVVLELPNPKNGNRGDDLGSFLLSLSLPYAQPDTDIKVEMSSEHNNYGFISDTAPINAGNYQATKFKDVQIEVDSTGRANDVYARVKSRVEYFNSNFPFPDYAMSALGGDSDDGIYKNFTTSSRSGGGCWYTTVENGSDSSPTDCGV